MTIDVRGPFARAVASMQYYYSVELASAPPHKVRTILQEKGWQFEPVQVDPGLMAGAAAFGGHYGLKYLPIFTIKSPTGQNIHASGNEALYRLYKNDLKAASYEAYLTPETP